MPSHDENTVPIPGPSTETLRGTGAPRRFPKFFTWTSGIVIAVCVLGYLAIWERYAASRLTVIRAGITEYASKVQTLEGKYSCTLKARTAGPNGRIDQSAKTEYDFAADFQNNRMSLESRELVNFGDMPGVTFRFRRVSKHGGGKSYGLTNSRPPQHEGNDWGEPHLLVIDRGSNSPLGPWDLAGIGMATQRGRVQQFEAADHYGKIRYRGTEVVNGATCERVTIDFGNDRRTFWLDPAHDYLPRRQQLQFEVIDVFEFRQFRDEATGGRTWFPLRGTVKHIASDVSHEFVVSELRINPSPDADQFQIDVASLPDGVKVMDNSKGGRPTYTGGREDLWKERDNAFEEGTRILKARIFAQPRPESGKTP